MGATTTNLKKLLSFGKIDYLNYFFTSHEIAKKRSFLVIFNFQISLFFYKKKAN